MPSILSKRDSARNTPKRSRDVTNGGLGGCVPIFQAGDPSLGMGPWSLKRKKVPTAIDTALSTTSGDIHLSTMTPDSIVLHNIALYEKFDMVTGEEIVVSPLEKSLPELPEVNELVEESAERDHVFTIRPQTPQTPEQYSTRKQTFELAGSILLPGQGFLPSDASDISSKDFSPSQSSGELRRESTPSLYTSSTADGEMDHLKGLWAASALKNKSDAFPTITKPLSGMEVEELMEHLPHLNMDTVCQEWMPAMEEGLKKIKALLQQSAELRLYQEPRLKTFGSVSLDSLEADIRAHISQDAHSLATSAKEISHTYANSMQKIEPLQIREPNPASARLQQLEAELISTQALIRKRETTITDNDQMIKHLHETMDTSLSVIGSFVQDHLGDRLDSIEDGRIQEVKYLIEKHQLNSENEPHSPTHYLRIPEQQYSAYLRVLHNAQQTNEAYSKIMKEQSDLINTQSTDLEKRYNDCGDCMTRLGSREQRISELELQVESQTQELAQNSAVAQKYDSLQASHRQLDEHCASLEWTLQNIKSGTEGKLHDRADEIFDLRQRLGDKVMETAAQRTGEIAALPSQNLSTSPPKFHIPFPFAKPSIKAQPIQKRRGNLPLSKSMLGLDFKEMLDTRSEISPDTASSISGLSARSEKSAKNQGSPKKQKAETSGLRMNPPEISAPISSTVTDDILSPAYRPRKDSLPTSTILSPIKQRSQGLSTSAPDREKALPTPPIPRRASDHNLTPDFPYASPSPQTPKRTDNFPPRFNENWRCLSDITEGTKESSDKSTPTGPKSPLSITSSDRKVIQNSMATLDHLITNSPSPRTPASQRTLPALPAQPKNTPINTNTLTHTEEAKDGAIPPGLFENPSFASSVSVYSTDTSAPEQLQAGPHPGTPYYPTPMPFTTSNTTTSAITTNPFPPFPPSPSLSTGQESTFTAPSTSGLDYDLNPTSTSSGRRYYASLALTNPHIPVRADSVPEIITGDTQAQTPTHHPAPIVPHEQEESYGYAYEYGTAPAPPSIQRSQRTQRTSPSQVSPSPKTTQLPNPPSNEEDDDDQSFGALPRFPSHERIRPQHLRAPETSPENRKEREGRQPRRDNKEAIGRLGFRGRKGREAQREAQRERML